MVKELDNFEDEEMNIFDEKVKEKEDSSSNKTLTYGMDERETIFLYSEIDKFLLSIFHHYPFLYYKAIIA